MNAMKYHKKYMEEQQQKKWEEERDAERKFVESLSPEARAVYEKEKEDRRKRAIELLSVGSMVAGPYSKGGR